MKWFLDTEFYEQGRDGIMRIEWISIGMVSSTGIEFYAENDDFDWSKVPADHWLQQNVRPHLMQSQTPDIAMSSREAAEYIEAMVGSKPIFYGWYCDYDWVVLCSLFGRMVDLPSQWPKFCRDLKQTTKELHMDPGHFPVQDDTEHHALNDAKWNLRLYLYIEDIRRGLKLGVFPPLNNFAASVKSFLGSIPFCAPENFGLMIEEKLRKPLDEYEKSVADSKA